MLSLRKSFQSHITRREPAHTEGEIDLSFIFLLFWVNDLGHLFLNDLEIWIWFGCQHSSSKISTAMALIKRRELFRQRSMSIQSLPLEITLGWKKCYFCRVGKNWNCTILLNCLQNLTVGINKNSNSFGIIKCNNSIINIISWFYFTKVKTIFTNSYNL